MKTFRLMLLLLISLALLSFSPVRLGFGKTPEGKGMPELPALKAEGPIEIEADHLLYDKEEQLYQAHGNVEIVRGDFSLKADHARMNTATQEMVAWGKVIMKEGEDVLECDRIEVNLKTQIGKVHQGKLFLKDQNYHIVGREAEKLGEGRYRLREGSFTTCDASRPPWKFKVKEIEITMEGTGLAKGPVFYVEDIPIFYLPAMPVPVKRERQSGFLIPQVGYSDQNGAEAKTAFYWAISKDMDATFLLDYLGDRGFKEGVEYRYAFPRETTGQAKFYYINDQEYEGKRYAFFIQHQQKLPYDFYLKGDINQVSDRSYPRDFDEDLPENTKIDSRSLNQLRSTLFGGKNWDAFSLLVEGDKYNNLTREDNNNTLQKYPQVSFYAHPQSFFKTPFFYDLSLAYVNFWRVEGMRANRLDAFPRISYPMRLFNILKVTPEVGYRQTYYRTYHDPDEDLNRSEKRNLVEADVEMSAQVYRVMTSSNESFLYELLGISRWMHTIEPFVGYGYIQKASQEDLPAFGALDRLAYKNEIRYGFTQRLLGKTEKDRVGLGAYEYVRLKLSQGYSLGDPYEVESGGKGRYFSDIQGELWMNFNRYLSFRGKAELNPYRWQLDIMDALIRVKDRRDDTLQVEYRYTRDKVEQLNLYTKVRTISPVYLYGGVRYNLLDRWRVESTYGAFYQAQCWSVGFLIEDINESPDGTQKKEIKVQAYVTLLGLGSLGHRPRIMDL